jgi:hypothetical protein
MFFSTAANADPHTGTGFANGTLILSGVHVPTGAGIPGIHLRVPVGILVNSGGVFPSVLRLEHSKRQALINDGTI